MQVLVKDLLGGQLNLVLVLADLVIVPVRYLLGVGIPAIKSILIAPVTNNRLAVPMTDIIQEGLNTNLKM